MTYEELEILIKNRRTSERRAELVRTISSDKEEAEGNNEHRQLELKKTTGELKDGMHSACAFLNTEGGWLTKDDTKDDTKDCIKELSDRQYLMMRLITLNDTITKIL